MTTIEQITIFTNNPVVIDVLKKYGVTFDISWINASALEVISTAQSAVRKGALLLSNPLIGVRKQSANLPFIKTKPTNQASSINPYLTVITSEIRETIDLVSVKRLNEALEFFKKNARLRFVGHNEDAIKIFQKNDLEAVLAFLNQLATPTP